MNDACSHTHNDTPEGFLKHSVLKFLLCVERLFIFLCVMLIRLLLCCPQTGLPLIHGAEEGSAMAEPLKVRLTRFLAEAEQRWREIEQRMAGKQ